MQTEAVFENIALRIIEEIHKAEKTIFIAVAWFTNYDIFNEIVLKASEGCSVQLMISNDDINNTAIDFSHLEIFDGKVYKIGNGMDELMHNKFCIIDYKTIITGSYNWSYKANNNFENIIINYNNEMLANQFVKEFNQIKKLYYPEDKINQKVEFPLDEIIERFEIIKKTNTFNIVIEEINKNKKVLTEWEEKSESEFPEKISSEINFIIQKLNSSLMILKANKVYFNDYRYTNPKLDKQINELKEVGLFGVAKFIIKDCNTSLDVIRSLRNFNHLYIKLSNEIASLALDCFFEYYESYKDPFNHYEVLRLNPNVTFYVDNFFGVHRDALDIMNSIGELKMSLKLRDLYNDKLLVF